MYKFSPIDLKQILFYWSSIFFPGTYCKVVSFASNFLITLLHYLFQGHLSRLSHNINI